MTNMGRLRRFLNLTQLDLHLATGIPIHRISTSERGLAELSETEERIVSIFLAGRLKTLRSAIDYDEAGCDKENSKESQGE